jgi:hypothetical protein
MLAVNTPPKFPKVWGQNAQGAFIRPIPVDSQIGIEGGAASLNDGFPPLTMTPIAAGGDPPDGRDMNGILKQITQTQQWQQAGGGWQFDANFVVIIGGYPQGAILNSKVVLGRQWVSTVDNNMTDPDSASAANWAPVAGQLPVGTPVPSFSPIVPPGFISANGLRLGNVASGADNASPSNLLLFRFVWLNFSNAQCPLFNSAGQAIARGANPDADWNANNKIVLPDGRCAGLVGVDGMGNVATGLLNGVPSVIGNGTTPGSIFGENLHNLIANEMPSHFHGAPISDPSHSHGSSHSGLLVAFQRGSSFPFGITTSSALLINAQNAFSISGNFTGVRVSGSNGVDTTNSTGGSQSHNTLHRSMTVYWNLSQ